MPYNHLAYAIAFGIAGATTLGAVEAPKNVDRGAGTPQQASRFLPEDATVEVIGSRPARTDSCSIGARFVMADVLNIRSAPGYGPVVGKLGKDARLDLTSCHAGWAQIGPDRWVAEEYLGFHPQDGAPGTEPGGQ